MISGTQALLFFVLLLCGLQEAAPSPRGHCAEGLCSFQVLLDFRGAESFCRELNGQLFSSKEIKTIMSLLKGLSGRFWLGNIERTGLHDCPAVSVTGGQNVTALKVPCKDKLDGQVCQYEYDEICRPLQASAGAKVKYTTIKGYELVDSEMLPPGTFATVGDGKYPDSKHLCASSWITAPWNCEVLNGGCEYICSSVDTCICPIGHTLHPNSISCVMESCAACAQVCQQKGDSYVCECYEGYRLAQDGTSCEDVNECEEKRDICTSEGEKCVNEKGGYKCECADDFMEEGGTCVNTAICFRCEHECDKINGVYQCVCNKNFKVSPKDPTKCEHHCGQSQCPALCDPNPDTEMKDVQCFCPEGYILETRNQTSVCYDIDECEQQNPCDHTCDNMFGGYRCWCDEGFKLVDDKCVRLENEDDELGSGLSSELVTPGDVQTAVLPSYVKAGSVMGITIFLVLIAVLLLFLARKMMKRCGRFTLTTFKHPDIDIFYLQQVTTDSYKRFSFDKQF